MVENTFVTFEGEFNIQATSEKAVFFINRKDNTEKWIPKAVLKDSFNKGDNVTNIQLVEWYANKNGLKVSESA